MFSKYLTLAALILPLTVIDSFAQVCEPREIMVDNLREKYGEHGVGYGLIYKSQTELGFVVEIFQSHDGGFSILRTDVETGIACMILAGVDFRMRPLPEITEGS